MSVPTDGNAVLTLLGYISTFIVTVLGAAVTVTWKLAAERRATEEKFDTKFEAARAERRDEIAASERNIGEGIRAVQENTRLLEAQVNKNAKEVGEFIRDKFVRRDDFEGMKNDIRDMNQKLDRIAQNMREDRNDRDHVSPR